MRFSRISVALALLVGTALEVEGQTAVWQGSPGDVWSDPGAWSTNSPPGSSNDVVFGSSPNSPSVVDNSYAINSLTIGGPLTLTSSLPGYTISTAAGVTDSASSFSTVYIGVGLTGAGGLTVNSSDGTLELDSPGLSTYSGNTVITYGTLSDNQANSYSRNSAVLIDNPGVLLVNFNESIPSLGDYSTGGGSVVIAASATLTLTSASDFGFSENISGAGGITFNGGANVTLNGTNNTYSGNTNVMAGSLADGTDYAFSPNSEIILWSGTELFVNFNEKIGILGDFITAGDTVLIAGDATLSIVGSGSSATFNGSITGDGGLEIAGANQGLAGTNSYSGNTVITSGSLYDEAAGAFSPNSTVLIDSPGGLFAYYNESIPGFADNTPGSGGSVYIGSGATLTLTGSAENSFSGGISGPGALAMTGGGVLTLAGSGQSTYSGDTILLEGSLSDTSTAANSFSPDSIVRVGSSGTLAVNSNESIAGLSDYDSSGGTVAFGESGNPTLSLVGSGSETFSGSISGPGNLDVDKSGEGSTTLAGSNYYLGNTIIQGGTLADGTYDALPSTTIVEIDSPGVLQLNYDETVAGLADYSTGGGSVTLGASYPTLSLTGSGTYSFSGVISGTGNLAISGGGTQVLSGLNTFTGNVTITNGTLTDAAAGAFSPNSTVLIDNPGNLVVNYNESIVGLADNTLGFGGNVSIAQNAALTLTGTSPNVFTGVISGYGGLTLGSNATITLADSESYTGPTLLGPGSNLTLGSPTWGEGMITSDVSGLGTLTFDETVDPTYSNDISGSVTVVQEGEEPLTLAGNNTYSGLTEVMNSTLEDTLSGGNFSPNSIMAIGSFGTLQVNGNEMVGGLEDYQLTEGGGQVYLATTGTTLDINGGTSTTFSGSIYGTGNLRVDGAETLTLTGTNTYSGTTEIGNGATLQLGDGSNTGALASPEISGSGGTLAYNDPGTTTYTGAIYGNVNLSQISWGTLVLAGTSNSYTGNTIVINGTLSDDPDGLGGNFSPYSPVLIGDNGTLTVNYNETIGGLSDYPTPGGTVNLAGSDAILTINGSSTTTFSGSIVGGGGLTLAGGTLILAGTNNTYSGSTAVISGTLADGAQNAFSPNSSIAIDAPGVLQVNYNESVPAVSDYSAGGGSVQINNYSVLTLTGGSGSNLSASISGTGGLTIDQGSGSTTLSGTNTYSGDTTIISGTLFDGGANTLSANSTVSVGASGALVIGYNETIAGLQDYYPGGGAVDIDNASTLTINGSDTLTFSGTINGEGANLVLGTPQTLILTNTGNTYTGTTTLASGATLQLGDGSNDGNIQTSQVMGQGALVVNNPDDTTLSFPITGETSLTQEAYSTTTLTGVNTYTGATMIVNGTIADGAPGAFSPYSSVLIDEPATLMVNFNETIGGLADYTTGAGYVVLNGSGVVLTINGNNPGSFSGFISGPGGLTLAAGANLNLVAENSYTGPTTIVSGATLTLGDGISNTGTLSTTAVSGAGELVFNNPSDSEFPGTISGSVTIEQTSSGNTTLSGVNTTTGDTVITNGTLTDGVAGAFSPASPIYIDGPGTLNVTYNETVPSVGDFTYGDGYVELGYGVTLTLVGPTSSIFSGTISGPGSLAIVAPSGTTTLLGDNTFSGGVTVDSASLFLGSDQALGTGSLSLEDGATVAVYGSGNFRTVSNPIAVSGNVTFGDYDNNTLLLTGALSGTGNVTYAGGTAGILELNPSSNTITGSYTIAGGQVIAQNSGAFGPSSNTVALTGNAALNVATGVTLANPLSFSGSSNVLAGSGTIASAVVANSSVVIAPQASPGGGPGNLTFSSGLELLSGSAISFRIDDAGGAAGTGYSLITATGGLSFSASPNTITFDVVSVDSSGNNTAALNFNSSGTYSWMFATSSTAITGFDASDFNIVTSGFQNSLGTGSFFVSETGDNLYLNFTPVPEPSTWALLAFGAAGLGFAALRRRRAARV